MVTKRKDYIPEEYNGDEYADEILRNYELHGKVANLFSTKEEVITAVINQKVANINEKILDLKTPIEKVEVLRVARLEILDILGMLSAYASSFERRREQLENKNNNNKDDE